MSLKLAFIGDGAIARSVRNILSGSADLLVVGILTQDAPHGGIYASDLVDLLRRGPDIVIECAGHAALKQYGCEILFSGLPLIVASIGALADPEVLAALTAAERQGKGNLILPSGAICGLDGLAAARLDDLRSVTYTSRKPPLAWLGTAAETEFNLRQLCEPTVIFRGDAREAATTFPKNANVAAAVALFGIGFERTKVVAIADPGVSRNIHELTYSGAFGDCHLTIANEPSADNPKTSRLTAFSIASRIIDWAKTRAAQHMEIVT